MVSRVLGTAPTVADAIIDQLSSVRDKATDAHLPPRPRRWAGGRAGRWPAPKAFVY